MSTNYCRNCGHSISKHNLQTWACPGSSLQNPSTFEEATTLFQVQNVPTEGMKLEVPKKTGSLPGTSAQPAPDLSNSAPASWDLVRADIEARNAEGVRKYGVPLKPGNGRDTLVDAYQEALDLVVYLRTAIYERDGK